MNNKLQILYNTLMTIETKGDSTKFMAECLRYLENLIKESSEPVEQVEDK